MGGGGIVICDEKTFTRVLSVWCRLLCQMSDPVGGDLNLVLSFSGENYNLIEADSCGEKICMNSSPERNRANQSALTHISGGKYSSFLRI